jgi:hypothetical protein
LVKGALLCLFSALLSCNASLTRYEELEPVFIEEYYIARAALCSAYPEDCDDIKRVSPTAFSYEEVMPEGLFDPVTENTYYVDVVMPDTFLVPFFWCGEGRERVEALGCYSRDTNHIQYILGVTQVIRHEMGHGILDEIGHEDWADWQHDE